MGVNLVMLIVAILIMCVARQKWEWSHQKIMFVFFTLLLIDLIFLGSNIPKLHEGAWLPLAFALFISIIMLTWQRGLKLVRTSFYNKKIPFSEIIKKIDHSQLNYINDLTMIFITDPYDNSGGSFYSYIKLNRLVPKQALVVSVVIEDFPFIIESKRYKLEAIKDGYFKLSLHYGFMQTIKIPQTVAIAEKRKVFPFTLDVSKATFLVEIIHISTKKKDRQKMYLWEKKLFNFLVRNSALDIDFYHLPYTQTMSIGNYI